MNPVFQIGGSLSEGFLILKLVFMTSPLCRLLSFLYVFINSSIHLINIFAVHLNFLQSHQK